MFDRFMQLFAEPAAGGGGQPGREALHVAAAALMMEAARLDDTIDPAERSRIAALVRDRFGLAPDEVEALMRTAEAETDGAAHHYDYVRTIIDRCPPDARTWIIEMLWEVAYADGVLHPLEANLLRRIGGLLYVSDVDRGEARKRVLRRLGLPEGTGL
jgi:uncharacterized tellurite resistance protein B-like protein